MKSSEDHGSTTSRSEVAVVGRCNWGLLGLLVAVWCWRRWDWFEFEKSVEEKEEKIKRRRMSMLMLFYFTILKTTLSFIPYYFTIPPHPKLLFVLKYYFFKLSLLFLSTVNFFSDFGVIPSFQQSHFFSTANFFPGLSKFQQPIFFNSHLNSHLNSHE